MDPDLVWDYPIKLLPLNPTNSHTTTGHLSASESFLSLLESLFGKYVGDKISEQIYVYLLLIRITEENTSFGMGTMKGCTNHFDESMLIWKAKQRNACWKNHTTFSVEEGMKSWKVALMTILQDGHSIKFLEGPLKL